MATTQNIIGKKMAEQRQELLNELWPELNPKALWHRLKTKGFITIPRCMSLILDIINQLSNGNPLDSTYFALWCHTQDESLTVIKDEKSMAFECGFKGQRAVTTWKSKMKALKELGFIDSQKGKCGEYNYVLLLNPFLVIKQHYKSGVTFINKESYLALVERAQETGEKSLLG